MIGNGMMKINKKLERKYGVINMFRINKEEEKAKEEYADNPTIEFHMINGELVIKGNPFNEEEKKKNDNR